MPLEPAGTLREQLEQNYDKIIAPAVVKQDAVIAKSEVKPEVKTEVKTEAKPDTRTAEERARDEKGRFVEKVESKDKDIQALDKAKAADLKTAEVKAEKLGVKRPDSWKKELWPIWDKLDAGESLTKEERKLFLEYLPQRESEYTRGVSAYKAEAEHAKSLRQALEPYQPFLNQHKLRPEEFVSRLAQTDQVLRFGTPQQKLQAYVRFAQDYQIPLSELFTQGEDGKVYLNQQYTQPQTVPAQDIDRIVNQKLNEKLRQEQMQRIERQSREFLAAKDKDGSPLYPHATQVWKTMGGLLRAGLATDLPTAYDKALRLPEHESLMEAERTKQREAKAREEAERASRAKETAVSVKTSTPTGSVNSGKKGLRATLEEAYDSTVGGRV